MATITDTRSDLEDFVRFLNKELTKEKVTLTVEQSVEEFRPWKESLDRLREEIRPALERSLRGESIPWDADAFKAEAFRRLEAKGITFEDQD